MADFFTALSLDTLVFFHPIVAILEFLEPFGKAAAAASKLIGLMPK
ncbi:hypothetical protein [Corynebacterium epidermidicanis]|uniref:Uncharacterized protein n=1 Tax=Corynebacterium epidermidicanis TaxID=1050174 RepID=A0A0G3GWT2_9CORY|nr:hypothetical protein [Corynebacterium epidermidicanis]AKK04003.1 hypothetical protein CEPID_10870 [Corynebacterium epidermidicanis]